MNTSTEQYRLFFESAPIGIIQYSKDGIISAVNEMTTRIFDSPREKLIGLPVDFIHNKTFRKEIHRSLSGEEGLFEGLFIHPSTQGETYIKAHCQPILEKGAVAGGVAFIEDYTRRRHVEKSLSESKARYKSLFHDSISAIYLFDAQKRFIDANQAGLDLLGYTRNELLKMTITDVDADPEAVIPAHNRLLGGGKISNYEHKLLRKDGTVIAVLNNSSPLFNEDGEIVGLQSTLIDISDRISAEKELQESESKYRGVVEDLPALVCSFLADGTITFVNRAYCDCFARRYEELVGVSFLTLIPEDERDGVMDAILSLTAESPSLSHEHQVLAPDGTVRWQRWTDRALFDKDGKRTSFQAIGEDITDSKRAEEELIKSYEAIKESENTYRALVETTDTGYLILNEKGEVVDANAEYVRQTGHQSLDEILGRCVTEWTSPHDLERNAKEVKKCLESGYVRDLQIDYVGKNGAATSIELNATVIKTEAGLRILSLCRDISERKRTEEQLLVLSRAIETSHEVIVTTDREGNISYANKALTKVFGYGTEELLGTPVTALVQDRSVPEQLTIPALLTSGGWSGEVLCLRKNGSLFPAFHTNSLISDKKNDPIGMLAIIRDMTEVKTSQQKKEELKKQLHQAQKMEAIGTLAGGIAHDFNNILSGIIGCAELARKEVPVGSVVDEELVHILSSGVRASDLVKQILAFSSRQEQTKAPLHPHIIIKEVMKLLRVTTPSSIQIVEDIHSDSGTILANPINLHQITMNLCTNALHSMAKEKGVLTVRLFRKEMDKKQLPNKPGLLPGNYSVLLVSDTGSGMDTTTKERIFEPYFTTKKAGDGTGLGLPVVHKIVDDCKGFIEVTSGVDQGTSVSIYLPTIEETGTQQKTTEDEKAERTAVPARILVVDDEELIVRITKKRLEELGHQVTAVSDSIQALNIFREQKDEIDLLITDQTMPGLTGAELAWEVLQIRPEIPVIMCTGHSEIVSEEDALDIGISKYVLKPLQEDELLDAVEELLRQKRRSG